MKKRLTFTFAALALVSLGGCSRPSSTEDLSPRKVQLLKQAHSGEDVCVQLGLPSGCDVCEELDYYGDGICDQALVLHGLCHRADPDCSGAIEDQCSDGMDQDGDGLVDCADPDCAYTPYCWPDPVCGNEFREQGEECDVRDFGGLTCESLGYSGGTLLCKPECTIDTSGCIPSAQEVCDNARDDDGDGLVDCTDPDCAQDPACGTAVCGNGILEPGEECDDGNLQDGDGCDSTCHVEQAVCGNGILEPGEECDIDDFGGLTCESLGYSGGTLICGCDCTIDTSSCTNSTQEVCDNALDDDGDGLVDCADPDCAQDPACGTAVCGNGILEPGEECDDGNLQDGDGCDSTCHVEQAVCGNGILEPGEECDIDDFGGLTCESLGYSGGSLACTPTCRLDTSGCRH